MYPRCYKCGRLELDVIVCSLPFAWDFPGRFHTRRSKGHHEPRSHWGPESTATPFLLTSLSVLALCSLVQNSFLTFARLTEDRTKQSELSASQMKVRMCLQSGYDCTLLNRCLLLEKCLAVNQAHFHKRANCSIVLQRAS